MADRAGIRGMARELLTDRAAKWIAWHVTICLDLKYPLRFEEVKRLCEPQFGDSIVSALERHPPELHHVITRMVLRELRFARHWDGDCDPPSIHLSRR